MEGSRSVKLLELPSAWKLSTPSVGKRAKMQPSSLLLHSSPIPRPLSPPLSCDAVESIYRDSPSPLTLAPFFPRTTPCIEEGGGGTLSASSSPTAESLGLGSDKGRTERTNEPGGKTTGVHLSRSRRSGLLFLRSFFYLAISPVSTVSPRTTDPLRPPPFPPLYPRIGISSKPKLYPGTGYET